MSVTGALYVGIVVSNRKRNRAIAAATARVRRNKVYI